MNSTNLIAAIVLARTIPPLKFHMNMFRDASDDECNKHCNTIGCWAGHLTTIIPDDQIIRAGRTLQQINFFKTTMYWLDISIREWQFLFEAPWADVDNTIDGCIRRGKYLLKHNKVPEPFEHVDAPLRTIAYYRNTLEVYKDIDLL